MPHTFDDAVARAVDVIETRSRAQRRAFFFIIFVIIVVNVATAAGAVWYAHRVAAQQLKTTNAITCALAAESQVTTQYLREFAKHFGGDLPPVPGLPHECGGNDPVFVGTEGADAITGTTDPDWINGQGGDDLIHGAGGGDTLLGYTGRDTIYGGLGVDYIYGGDGADELHAGGDSSIDHLDGGAGTDTCYKQPNDVAKNCEKVVIT